MWLMIMILIDDECPEMEIELGKEALKRSAEYVNIGMEKMPFEKVSFRSLRKYFEIDNVFVARKLLLIVFPFNNSGWRDDGDGLTRPELYIPMMSFISYILLRMLYLGVEGAFSPERFGIVFSRLMFLEMICVMVMKMAGYFVDVHLDVVDMVCYDGYKYVAMVVLGLMMMCGGYVRMIVSVYVYVSFFVFLSRSMKRRVIGNDVNRSKKIYFLFGSVMIQVFIVFVLS